MKKLFYILVLFSGIANAQIVNIPNAYFKNRLIADGYDINHDGEIQYTEALLVHSLDFYGAGANVTDLTGIEAFTNVTDLDCTYSNITSLNISTLTNLVSLSCSSTNLTSLDISNLPNLEVVYCQSNQFLTNLNASNDLSLTTLSCSANLINTLNVSNDNALSVLYCGGNELTSVDLSSLTGLTKLYCNNNQLTALDVTSSVNLIELYCGWNQLTSLSGFSATNALTKLDCSQNPLSNLDLSVLTNLTFLDCSGNGRTSLNVLPLTNLTELDCNNNDILSFNLSTLSNLVRLSCNGTGLTTLDVTALVNLTYLDCSHNQQLTVLDITPLVHLSTLYCGDTSVDNLDFSTTHDVLTKLTYGSNSFPPIDLNQFSNIQVLSISNATLINTIDVSSLIHMQEFDLYNSNVTTLDFSGCHSLTKVRIQNNPNLIYINLKTGIPFVPYFSSGITSNANLIFICSNEGDETQIHNSLNYWNPSLVINSYCSFSPGGDNNIITGTITLDANGNGCDVDDILHPNIRVNINDGINQGASFTNEIGNYKFYTQAGSFVITSDIENPTWFNFSPSSATIPFANTNNNIVTQDFCVSANGIHPDVEVVIAPTTSARPGFDAVYKVVYKNKGNQTLSGNVNFTYDDSVLDFVSSTVTPDSQSTGTLTYNYTNLLPFENRSFSITLHVNAPTDTPAVNIGDQLNFTATVNPIGTDENPSDNTFLYNQTVVGSYDPNDVTCIEGNIVSPTEIGNYLHYVINFENTGTADAENIVVRDVIDTTQFDVNSLQLLNSSAPVTAKLTGNVAEFIFQDINLHSGGHGNILIKVKSKSTLVQGATVSKRANIYFDYNAPVNTNLENTTFQALSNPDYETDGSISVYPNPSKGNVNINCNNTIKSVQLFDIQGRLLQTNLANENQTTIDISNQSNGVYFLKIISDKGIRVEKIMKE